MSAQRRRKRAVETADSEAVSGAAPEATAAAVESWPSWRAWCVLVAMAAAFVTLSVTSLARKSVTIDEFGHLPAGWNILQTGDFRYAELNPPLMNVLSAMPLLAVAPPTPESGPELAPHQRFNFWLNGYAFMSRYWTDYQRFFVSARIVTVGMAVLLGGLVFLWAHKLTQHHGTIAGLLAAGLVWFSPNVLANARLVTTDVGCAFFVALALFALHMYLRSPSWWRAALAGCALGAAQLVKFSAVWLYPVFVVLAVIWWIMQRRPTGKHLVGGIIVMLVISAALINAGYLFERSATPIGELSLSSAPLKGIQSVAPAWAPVLLPASFVEAFDQQLRDASVGDPSFLFGEKYFGGRWYFFLALLAIKMPVPGIALGIVAVAIGAACGRRSVWPAAALLIPAATFVAVFSLLSNKQLGLRMILPAAPLAWLWVSVVLAEHVRRRWALGTLAVLLGWFAVESLTVWPNYLPYFNEFVGGPSQGYKYATGSNVDWGQDLIGLREYMKGEGIKSIQLLYFGRVDPSVYGIGYDVPLDGLQPGFLAVSVSFFGRGYWLNDHGRLRWVQEIDLDPKVLGPVVADIGDSIHVYRIARAAGRAP